MMPFRPFPAGQGGRRAGPGRPASRLAYMDQKVAGCWLLDFNALQGRRRSLNAPAEWHLRSHEYERLVWLWLESLWMPDSSRPGCTSPLISQVFQGQFEPADLSAPALVSGPSRRAIRSNSRDQLKRSAAQASMERLVCSCPEVLEGRLACPANDPLPVP